MPYLPKYFRIASTVNTRQGARAYSGGVNKENTTKMDATYPTGLTDAIRAAMHHDIDLWHMKLQAL